MLELNYIEKDREIVSMKKISTMSIIALVTAMLGACQNDAAVTKAPAAADKTTKKKSLRLRKQSQSTTQP
ncbi:hypothetical protein [Amylolactobacillus amylophilus]|uniref:hypothetical protein n=1 Tax=Amylolactobacillus amylophilus TaxID=1603 RepID=UPI002092AB88|nr:hypothetical protein [Amylolactobacillus amylophilus]